MDDQYTRRRWALDARNGLRTPPLPDDIRPESDTNTLEQNLIDHANRVATQSDGDTLNAPDQDSDQASNSTGSIAKPKPKKRHSTWVRLSSTWWLEIVTLFISTGCMAGLIAILAGFQNRLTTDWTFFISINAAVAIAITAARATLLAAVSVVLSQEKWSHFNNKARRLQDLNIIDRASRGPLGSIQMLFTVSWGWATVSAVVMILSILTDTFVQQVVYFQPGNIYAQQNGSATFGHAVSYSSGLNFDWGSYMHEGLRFYAGGVGAVNPDLQSAFFRGIWQTSWPSGVNCTSNCTWDQSYLTVGFSSTCADVTKETVESVKCADNRTYAVPYGYIEPCNLTTPQGLFFPFVPTPGGSSMAINASGWAFDSEPLDGRSLSKAAFWTWDRADVDFTNMGIALKPMLQNSTVVECTLGIALYNYSDVSFISNNFNIGSSKKIPLGNMTGATVLPPPECSEYTCIQLDSMLWWNSTGPGLPNVSFSKTDLSLITHLFTSPSFSGSIGPIFPGSVNAPPAGSTTAFGDGSLKTVSGIFDNMAQSLTDLVREKGTVQIAQGLTSQAVVYMRVQWLWLILPITLQVLGALALIGAMVGRRQTKGVPLWKGAALAVLYHSVDKDGVLGTRVKDLQELEDLGLTQAMLEKNGEAADP